MNWELIFTSANRFALLCWLILLFAPQRARILPWLFYFGTALLALCYTMLIIPIMMGLIDPVVINGVHSGPPNFSTLAGVMALFDSKGGTTVGWIHYLAFDLFVGIWIARNADRRAIHRLAQIPILAVTFLFGPIGLTFYLILRQFVGQRTENALVPY